MHHPRQPPASTASAATPLQVRAVSYHDVYTWHLHTHPARWRYRRMGLVFANAVELDWDTLTS